METTAPRPPLAILAVEENPADVATIRWVLTAHALTYDLQVIETADHALRFFDQLAAREHPRCPDMLLLDLTLLQRHGKGLLAHLKTIPACAAMRVVILTASHDPAERTETLALGADVVFVKPFHLTDFMALGPLIKTLACALAPTQTREQAARARQARSHQLAQKSQELRGQSQELSGRVQVLCAVSAQVRRTGGFLAWRRHHRSLFSR